jgi:hypothetical protein
MEGRALSMVLIPALATTEKSEKDAPNDNNEVEELVDAKT